MSSFLKQDICKWLYASIAIWSFDRFISLVRMAILNISWSLNRLSRAGNLEIIGPDTIKATINIGYNISFQPGQYIFIYFPRLNFRESHPFTIVEYKVISGQPMITLLLRTHHGITKKLQKYLVDGSKELYCLLESPYGHYC